MAVFLRLFGSLLTDTYEVLNISNKFLATIPPEFGNFRRSLDTVVNLSGNINL